MSTSRRLGRDKGFSGNGLLSTFDGVGRACFVTSARHYLDAKIKKKRDQKVPNRPEHAAQIYELALLVAISPLRTCILCHVIAKHQARGPHPAETLAGWFSAVASLAPLPDHAQTFHL